MQKCIRNKSLLVYGRTRKTIIEPKKLIIKNKKGESRITNPYFDKNLCDKSNIL